MLNKISESNESKKSLISQIDLIASLNNMENIDPDYISRFSILLSSNKHDSNKMRTIKKKAFNFITPILESSTEYLNRWTKYNTDNIHKIIDAIREEVFNHLYKISELNIREYDVVFFDIDNTICKGSRAGSMKKPFTKLDEQTIMDSEGKTISLKDGVKETFIKLRALNLDIGIISHSEDKSKKAEEQPIFELLKLFEINDFINDNIVVISDLPKSIFIPRDKKVLFVDDELDNLEDIIKNTNADVVNIKDVHFDKAIPVESKNFNWYKISKRDYIPVSERPSKPKKDGDYELDHKVPRWKGGKDTKDNLKWVEKEKHKNKTKNEGSYEYGGKDRHKKLKSKGNDNYSKYQSETAKKKMEKEKKELGDDGFSKLQSERAKKRWRKKK